MLVLAMDGEILSRSWAGAESRGVGVTCFCPGFVETAIHDRTRKWSAYLDHPENRRRPGRFPRAEACLPAIRGMLRGNKAIVMVPRSQAAYWWLFRLFPSALPRMWAIIIGRLRRQDQAIRLPGTTPS